jgi:hypothetical protein
LFLLCRIISGTETPSSETDAVQFFGAAEIPELSTNRVTSARIRRVFEHYRDPALPTDCDRDL